MTTPEHPATATPAPLHPSVYLPPATEDPARHAELHDHPYGTTALTAWAAQILIDTHCPDRETLTVIDTAPGADEADGAIRVRRYGPALEPETGTVPGPRETGAGAALGIAIVRRDTAGAGTDRDWITRVEAILRAGQRALRAGGILAVPVPDPVPGPGFFDPSGYLVTTAQSLGLRYHQHLIFLDEIPETDPPAAPLGDPTGSAPTHERAHHDVLLFAVENLREFSA